MQVVIYEFNLFNSRYLIHKLFPDALRLVALTDDDPEHVFRALADKDLEGRFIFHFDLTDPGCVPLRRRELCDHLTKNGLRLVNENVTTIAKRFVQKTLVKLGLPITRAEEDGDDGEWLLVKTDRNSGGSPEMQLSEAEHITLGLYQRAAQRDSTRGYRLLQRRDVTPEVWSDPELIVERYVSNENNTFMRGYILEDRMVISEAHDDAVIKRMDRALGRRNFQLFRTRGSADERNPEHIQRAAEAMRLFADAISLDFGCIDFTLNHKNEPFIIDLNTTPHWGIESTTGLLEHLIP
jgi:hypothetical protein